MRFFHCAGCCSVDGDVVVDYAFHFPLVMVIDALMMMMISWITGSSFSSSTCRATPSPRLPTVTLCLRTPGFLHAHLVAPDAVPLVAFAFALPPRACALPLRRCFVPFALRAFLPVRDYAFTATLLRYIATAAFLPAARFAHLDVRAAHYLRLSRIRGTDC